MVHNFTLVHDDIMDNDDIRHGVPTVHKKFGLPIAILALEFSFRLPSLHQAADLHIHLHMLWLV